MSSLIAAGTLNCDKHDGQRGSGSVNSKIVLDFASQTRYNGQRYTEAF